MLRKLIKLPAHWQILGALLLATLTAVVLRQTVGDAATGFVEACAFVGDLFIRALKMIIVPLVVSSVIAGLASLKGVDGFGRLGLKTLAFYATSTLLAVLVGLVLVNLIQPGLEDGVPNETIRTAFESGNASASDSEREKVAAASQREASDFLGIFQKMFPTNIFAAASDNGQLLGLIVFSLLFGIGLTQIDSPATDRVTEIFEGINEVMILITRWIMALAPIGVAALIVPVVFRTGAELFLTMGSYFLTVLLALLIHLCVVLPLLLKLVARVSPLAHFRAMREALVLAFSTASSSATLPVTLRCIQENAGVSKRTASFTLPLGATVNMDGTALYECVAVIFVAQVMGVGMDVGAQVTVVIAALLTSIGVAGIPSASLVAILLILKTSGIEGAEMAVVALLAVDRLLDMCRTAVNVFGDSCAAVVVAKSEGEAVLSDAAIAAK